MYLHRRRPSGRSRRISFSDAATEPAAAEELQGCPRTRHQRAGQPDFVDEAQDLLQFSTRTG